MRVTIDHAPGQNSRYLSFPRGSLLSPTVGFGHRTHRYSARRGSIPRRQVSVQVHGDCGLLALNEGGVAPLVVCGAPVVHKGSSMRVFQCEERRWCFKTVRKERSIRADIKSSPRGRAERDRLLITAGSSTTATVAYWRQMPPPPAVFRQDWRIFRELLLSPRFRLENFDLA